MAKFLSLDVLGAPSAAAYRLGSRVQSSGGWDLRLRVEYVFFFFFFLNCFFLPADASTTVFFSSNSSSTAATANSSGW